MVFTDELHGNYVGGGVAAFRLKFGNDLLNAKHPFIGLGRWKEKRLESL